MVPSQFRCFSTPDHIRAFCGRQFADRRATVPPPALRAGNRLPLGTLPQARRVAAASMPIRHTAQNACDRFSNQNALTELAAEASLHPISSFAVQWRWRRQQHPDLPAGDTTEGPPPVQRQSWIT
jgi:hypothetical protein